MITIFKGKWEDAAARGALPIPASDAAEALRELGRNVRVTDIGGGDAPYIAETAADSAMIRLMLTFHASRPAQAADTEATMVCATPLLRDANAEKALRAYLSRWPWQGLPVTMEECSLRQHLRDAFICGWDECELIGRTPTD